jgi:hypothetical protein
MMHRHLIGLIGLIGLAAALPARAATLTVGPGQQYSTIAAAVAASMDGDTIDVQAGVYINDFAEITTQISLVAVHGRVTMKATEDLPSNKGILITDTNISITGFNFEGAKVPVSVGENGAGIRYQGGNLTVTECYFLHNQEGLLAAPDPAGSITIINSEFAYNGVQRGPLAGYEHNIYAGAVALLDIEGSWFHNAFVGHEIKSRAAATTVNNTRITDGPAGTASYSIDLPNGGVANITNDQIEKGPMAQNPNVIAYGEEGNEIPGSSLTVSNTLIEDDGSQFGYGVFNQTVQSGQTPVTAVLTNLSIYALPPADLYDEAATVSGTTYLASEPVISTKHPF